MDKSNEMKQVIQNFKTGKLYVDEVPPPALSKGMVLVENRFSLISAGTERSTVKVGKASLIMVSHSVSILKDLCQAGIWLDQGRAVWYDRLEDAIRDYHQSIGQ